MVVNHCTLADPGSFAATAAVARSWMMAPMSVLLRPAHSGSHEATLAERLARSVEALAERVGLSVANASQHLQQLRRAGHAA